jgi:hypothetical protein
MPKKDNRLVELEKAYSAQIKRRDAEIEELKKKNDILMRTAMRQNEKLVEIQELLRKIEKEKEQAKP